MSSEFTEPLLPQELTDIIIEIVSQNHDLPERTENLTSLARVCSRFRHVAHKELFKDILIVAEDNNIPGAVVRLQGLRDLLDSDPHLATSGIVSYIQSFTLRVNARKLPMGTLLQTRVLSTIFRRLFHSADHLHSLGLVLSHYGSLSSTLSWDSEISPSDSGDEFRASFSELCRRPTLRRLRLEGISNVPYDIIHHTSIRDIKFLMVTPGLKPCGTQILVKTSMPFVPLQSMEIDHCFPPTLFLDATPPFSTPSDQIFAELRHLKSHIYREEHIEKTELIVKDSLSLETLDIVFDGIPLLEPSTPPMELGHLTHLTHLSFSYPNLRKSKINLFPTLCHLIKHFIPPKSVRKISLSTLLVPASHHTTLAALFNSSSFDFRSLDDTLSSPSFQHVESINLHFTVLIKLVIFGLRPSDTTTIEETAEELLPNTRFPAISAATKPPKVEFKIMDRNAGN